MDDAKIISSEVSLTLGLPPSCIQFCPAYPKLFVVGTYNLEKNEDDVQEGNKDDDDAERVTATKTSQSRNGSLLVFKVDGTKLHLVQTVSQPSAILDLRFHPFKDKHDILAVASSTGTLAVFKLDPARNSSAPLQHISTSRCEDIGEDVLFLQCNWHPGISNVIGVTTSTSSARLLQLDEGYCIRDYTELNIANSLEAWCIAFSSGAPASTDEKAQVTAYCGGDDSLLRYTSSVWDPNDSDSPCEEPYSPITIKGTHNAGVTAVLPLFSLTKNNGRVVVTGSYDDHLRVFIINDLHETYGMKKVELVLEENMGGGVWRLDLVRIQKDTDSTKIRILASCMHAGARFIELEVKQEQDWSCKVLARFEEHKSMNYGSDFVRGDQAGETLWCVSTSFYDKLLCFWKYEP
ncbi:hypothetical protein ACHAPO_010972 [Fusarium lateritium]